MEAGNDPAYLWDISFREYRAIMKGAANRLKREHNANAWLAWHIEALARQKKLPKLQSMLHSDKPKRRQTVDEQIAVARAWAALAGSKGRGGVR